MCLSLIRLALILFIKSAHFLTERDFFIAVENKQAERMTIIVDMPGLRVNTPEAKPNGLIDPWPFRAKDLIVLVSSSLSDRKGNNKVGKCKLKIFVWE